jgi:hypothetical protein
MQKIGYNSFFKFLIESDGRGSLLGHLGYRKNHNSFMDSLIPVREYFIQLYVI